ncbi:MAG TPA: S8 family peptidase [Frankiaceae bacterium]|nr:S8 family peptidase [Frankiaceae bacterium]
MIDRAGADVIADRYIVTLRDGSSGASVAAALGVAPTHVYTSALNGFAAKLDAVQLAAVLADPAVQAVEEDRVVRSTTTYNTVHSGWDAWGLDRIDQRALPLSNTFTVNNTASGVNAYIFDSGARYSHLLFGGRATFVYDAFGGDGTDCDGHGTHVAGIVGGAYGTTVTGVASAVNLKIAKVLDCTGNGSVAGIIAAIDHVRANHTKPAVANMSLGVNGISTSFNTAIQNLINAGVTTVVAAGNSSQDACNFSPGAVTSAIVVAASDRKDTRATFSNHGPCVDLYAPGVAIWSAYHDGDGNLARVDGTSQASPHVAGVAALYLATNPAATPSAVQSYIVTNSTPNVIGRNRTGTPNRLLFSNGL